MSKINKTHENKLIATMNAKFFIAKIFAQPQTFFRMVFAENALLLYFMYPRGLHLQAIQRQSLALTQYLRMKILFGKQQYLGL